MQDYDPFQDIHLMRLEAVVDVDESVNHSRRRLIKDIYQDSDNLFEISKNNEQDDDNSISSVMSSHHKLKHQNSVIELVQIPDGFKETASIEKSLSSKLDIQTNEVELKSRSKFSNY
mmetsp:Transcript_10208/g.9017  ORF Transcript_10208/g.9017 Transcript_10208/m.9017 type:complete len:117 (-) Transcript_10208:23-373(-)